MMALKAILCLGLGWSNVYLIPAQTGHVLIDAGGPGMAGWFLRTLKRHNIDPGDIKLIIITHAHLDHVGGLSAIQAACGAAVMVHQREASILADSQVVVPDGLNLYGTVATSSLKFLNSLLRPRYKGYRAEHLVSGGESLAAFGLDGTVLHTPGHSPGSISVVLASGEAFVGDVAVNTYPFGLGPIFPPFGHDREAVYASWQKLLDAGARIIHSGHGAPFDAGRLRDRLARRADNP